MGKLLVICAAILAGISVATALQCLKCSFTVFGLPCHTSTVTCEAEQQCATIRGRAAGHKLIMKRNCVDKEKCDKNETASFGGISYVTSYECCETDFCNSSDAALPSARLSLPLALALLGVWLARLL